MLSSSSSDVENHSDEEDDLKDDALFLAVFSLCCRCAVLLSSTFKQNVKYIHYRYTMAAIVQISLVLVRPENYVLGHLSHSSDILQLVFVQRCASSVNNFTFFTS